MVTKLLMSVRLFLVEFCQLLLMRQNRRDQDKMSEGWLVCWLEFNVPFQHKYGYIRDEDVRSM